MQIAKHDTMRCVNTSALLQCLCENGPLTRNELQSRTGLSWGAVSNIVSELITRHILCETPVQSSHSGRKPYVVDINRSENLCVGVDIHTQELFCVVTDIRGQALVSLHKDNTATTRQALIDQAIGIVREAIAQAGVPKTAFLGVGVSIQGSIDREKGVSLYSPHLPDWSNVPICDLFRAEFDLPVVLLHDTHAMVIAEEWRNARKAHSFAFIRLDMGVGMALFLNDRLYTGADGNASEFGHMIIDPDGPLCTCGNKGCLEAFASGRSILQQVRQGVLDGRCTLQLGGEEPLNDLELVAQAARDGSPFECELFTRLGQYLGIGVSNLINVLNPELVILGGMLSRYTDLYLEAAMEQVKRNVWNANRVNFALSTLGANGAAIGAAAAVTQQVESGEIAHPLGDLLRLSRSATL